MDQLAGNNVNSVAYKAGYWFGLMLSGYTVAFATVQEFLTCYGYHLCGAITAGQDPIPY